MPSAPIANITSFSVGQDLQQLLLIPANGTGVAINSATLGRLVEFNATPVIQELDGSPLNLGGIQLVRNIYRGWHLEANFMRYNGNLSLLMASAFGRFNQLGLETFYTVEAIVVDSGQAVPSVNTYTFVNTVISGIPIGMFGETSRVEQRMTMRSQQILINGQVPTSYG